MDTVRLSQNAGTAGNIMAEKKITEQIQTSQEASLQSLRELNGKLESLCSRILDTGGPRGETQADEKKTEIGLNRITELCEEISVQVATAHSFLNQLDRI